MAKNERRDQRKREKKKKRRDLARQRSHPVTLHSSTAGLVRLASSSPFGPAWVSREVWATDEEAPELVTVTVTRKLPGGLLLPHILLVDRTCLGVKNAVVVPPTSELSAADLMASMTVRGSVMERCEPGFAQSVVLHAVRYARSLGFEPHRDFKPSLLEQRPEPLVETPLAQPERPIYVSGPSDDVRRVLGKLDRAVGDGNYRFVVLAPRFESLGDEDDEDDDGVREERVEATGVVPSDDVFEGLDLEDDVDLGEAVKVMVHLLESRWFLRWEASICEERGLPLSEAQSRALDDLVSFSDDQGPTLYIDGSPRPLEPWYESARRLAPRLVLDRFETREVYDDGVEARGVRLLDAIERHGGGLSLPDGCPTPRDVVPADLRHRLRLQELFDVFAGIGEDVGEGPATLSDPDQADRVTVFAQALEAHTNELRALRWTLDDLFSVLVLPPRDQAFVLERLRAMGHPAASLGRDALSDKALSPA